MIKTLIISITIFILGLGCSSFNKSIHKNNIISICAPPAKSEIVKNELIGIADTTIAILSGHIFNKNSKKAIMYVNVMLIDKKTKYIYGMATDKNGYYYLTVLPSTYDFKVSYIGYSGLHYELILKTGEKRRIDVELGQ